MKNVLLVSSMQNDFFSDSSGVSVGIEDKSSFKDNVANFIAGFDGLVFLSKYENFEGSVIFNNLPKHCLVGTSGSEIINEINSVINTKCENDPSFIPYTFNSRELINNSLCTTIADMCTESELHVIGLSLNGNILDNIIQIANDAVFRREYIPTIIIHRDLFFDTNKELFDLCLSTKLVPYFKVQIV